MTAAETGLLHDLLTLVRDSEGRLTTQIEDLCKAILKVTDDHEERLRQVEADHKNDYASRRAVRSVISGADRIIYLAISAGAFLVALVAIIRQ
jgi:hypothetical protein